MATTEKSIRRNDRMKTRLKDRLVDFDLRQNTPKYAVTLYLLTFLVLLFGDLYMPITTSNKQLPIPYQVIYYVLIIAPHLLWCLPLRIGFITEFPPSVRGKIVSFFPVRLELVLLVLLVLTVPVVLVLGLTDVLDANEAVKAQEIAIEAASLLAVIFQLVSFITLNDKRQLFGILKLSRHQSSGDQQPTNTATSLEEYSDTSIESLEDKVYPLKRIEKSIRASTMLSAKEIAETENEARNIAASYCCACNMAHTTLLCPHAFKRVSQLKGARKLGVAELESCCCMPVDEIQDESSSDVDQTHPSLSELVIDQLQSSSAGGDAPEQAFRFLLHLLLQFPVLAYSFLIAILSVTIAVALLPYTQALVIDAVASTFMQLQEPEADDSDLESIARQILIPSTVLLGNQLILPLFEAATLFSASKLAAKVEQYVKNSICRSVLGVDSMSVNDNTKLLSEGDLVSRFGADVSTIGSFIDGTIKWDLVPGLVNVIVSVVLLGMFDLRIAIFFALCIPIVIVTQSTQVSATETFQKDKTDHSDGDPAANQQDRFLNLVKLRRTNDLYDSGNFLWSKIGGPMDSENSRLSEERVSRAWFVVAVTSYANIYTAVIIFAFLLSLIDMLENGDEDVILGATVGISIIGRVYSPISSLTRAGPNWFRCSPALLRIQQLLGPRDHESDMDDGDAEEVPLLSKSFELDGIRFTYPESEVETLKGISQKFESGQYVCICGESGAGKSTLLNILTREAVESDGRLLVDGVPVTSDQAFRQQLGVVLQDSTFFLGTVRDNILMGRPDASQEEIQQAVERAQCAGFIEHLPDGIDTILGGETLNVSGGQAQRISLARALIRSPRFLILDEATSALDVTTEREVIETITRLAHEDHVLVVSVTHRLDTTDYSDKIVVLRDGFVAEEGPPAELNKDGAIFSNLRRGVA